MSRPFCYAPWLGISLRQDGEWKPCGAFQESLGRIDQTTVVAKESLQQLKERLLAHNPPTGCSLCLLEESEGRHSKRLKIHDHVRRKNLFPNEADLATATPIHLELAFSNRCNFTCSMCSAEYSSSWRKMVDEYTQEVDQTKKSGKPVFQISNEQRSKLLEISQSIQTLQVLGGEPLYDQQFHKYLSELAEINPSCDVCVATNGSLLTANFLATMNQFRSGSLDLSIDGVGPVYEYVRGFSFAKLEERLDLLHHLQRHILVSIFFSPGLYNFYDLPNFLRWGRQLERKHSQLKFQFRFDQIVSMPEQQSSLVAPLPLRQRIAGEIRGEMTRSNWKNGDLEHFANYLERPFSVTPDLLNLARKSTDFFNRKRSLSLWDISPDMNFLQLTHLPRLQAEFIHH